MFYYPYNNFKIRISFDIDFLNKSQFFFLLIISLLNILTANFSSSAILVATLTYAKAPTPSDYYC